MQIVTTFAIVASVVGASLTAEVVVISGFAKLVGDGIASESRSLVSYLDVAIVTSFRQTCAVGMGDTISEIAEMNYIKGERSRELAETETCLEYVV